MNEVSDTRGLLSLVIAFYATVLYVWLGALCFKKLWGGRTEDYIVAPLALWPAIVPLVLLKRLIFK